jgi:hypothetical protein
MNAHFPKLALCSSLELCCCRIFGIRRSLEVDFIDLRLSPIFYFTVEAVPKSSGLFPFVQLVHLLKKFSVMNSRVS